MCEEDESRAIIEMDVGYMARERERVIIHRKFKSLDFRNERRLQISVFEHNDDQLLMWNINNYNGKPSG